LNLPVGLAAPHHLLAVGIKRIVYDPLGPVVLHVVIESEVAKTSATDQFFARTYSLTKSMQRVISGRERSTLCSYFDGDVPVEPLPLQLVEDRLHVGDARPPRHVVAIGLVQVLEVNADHAAFEDLEALDRVQPRSIPVSSVRARADPRVAIIDYREDVAGSQTL
jgi:hypothetical protein